MSFILSKVLWFFVRPSTVALIFLLAGAALQWTCWKKAGRNLLTFLALFGVVLLFVPAGEVLITHLEARFPRVAELPERVDGIVVLGGAIDLVASEARRYPVLNGAFERLRYECHLRNVGLICINTPSTQNMCYLKIRKLVAGIQQMVLLVKKFGRFVAAFALPSSITTP